MQNMQKQTNYLYVAEEMLLLVKSNLVDGDQFVTNKGANTFCVGSEGKIILDPTLRSNASEVDQIVWLHSLKSCAQKVLIFSLDTDDVYHIGLSAKTEMVQNCDIMHDSVEQTHEEGH